MPVTLGLRRGASSGCTPPSHTQALCDEGLLLQQLLAETVKYFAFPVLQTSTLHSIHVRTSSYWKHCGPRPVPQPPLAHEDEQLLVDAST